MPKKGERMSATERDKRAHGARRAWERKRQQAHLLPRDLQRLEREGVVAPQLAPIVAVAKAEGVEIAAALGGEEGDLTPQRRAMVEDLVACGIALRGTLQLYLQTHDSELASRIATLTNARKQVLQALGLERFAKQIDPLSPVDVEWESDSESGFSTSGNES